MSSQDQNLFLNSPLKSHKSDGSINLSNTSHDWLQLVLGQTRDITDTVALLWACRMASQGVLRSFQVLQ
eukprot:6206649-Pleurochrysis_carterae.AAC.1